jgi:hypothetical protein
MAAFYHHGAVPWFVDRIMGILLYPTLYKSIIMKESPKEIYDDGSEDLLFVD